MRQFDVGWMCKLECSAEPQRSKLHGGAMTGVHSVSFENETVTFDNGASIDFSDIKRILYNIEERTGKIHVEISGKKEEYIVSLKAAYALILILGTSPWVNL